jgi:hypothetical protein
MTLKKKKYLGYRKLSSKSRKNDPKKKKLDLIKKLVRKI